MPMGPYTRIHDPLAIAFGPLYSIANARQGNGGL